jgi:hypothetical protein
MLLILIPKEARLYDGFKGEIHMPRILLDAHGMIGRPNLISKYHSDPDYGRVRMIIQE